MFQSVTEDYIYQITPSWAKTFQKVFTTLSITKLDTFILDKSQDQASFLPTQQILQATKKKKSRLHKKFK